MTLTVGTASGNRQISSLHLGTADGNRVVQQLWLGTADGNKLIYSASPPLTAVAAPDTLDWISDGGSGFVSDGSSTATPTGGTGPYTYAWELVSGLPGDIPIDPTNATTGFFSNNDFVGVTFRCLVTDSLGAPAYTNDVTVSG